MSATSAGPKNACQWVAFLMLAIVFSAPIFSQKADAAEATLPLVHAVTGADFVLGGVHPDMVWPKNLADPARQNKLVIWGTWMRHPVEGEVELGPFKGPKHFSMVVGGMPFDHGNLLLLVRLIDHAVIVITRNTPGKNWEQVDLTLPDDWLDQRLQIQGVGYQHTDDSWLAFSEPFNIAADGTAVPLWADRTAPLRWHYWGSVFLLPWLVIFALYSIVGISGFTLIRRYFDTPVSLTPVLIAGVVALAGYITFWAFWIKSECGMITAWTIIALSTLHFLYCIIKRGWFILPREDTRELKWPVLLLITCALFYLSLLNMPRVDATSMEVLASRRPTTWTLPSDNVLQQDIAWFLYHHRDARSVNNPIWQSSDRPPLEGGVELLATPLLVGVMKEPWDVSTQLSGMILQLIWIYGAWALLRALGFSARGCSQIILCLIATPFLYINTIFIWSKLSAATFSIGTTLILCFRNRRPIPTREVVLAGMLLALGMLAHSGTIFYLIPILIFWFVFPNFAGKPRWRHAAILCVTAALTFLPWTLYQKLYDPPGDHLLKLHLAGAMDTNAQSTFKSIKLAYKNTPNATLWANKVSNFNSLIKGDWTTLFKPLSSDIPRSREDYFLYTFRSCGLFILGFAALAVLPIVRKTVSVRPYFFLLAAILTSLVMWCLIMFGPDSTIIHQGAYANQLILLIVLTCALRLLHPAVLLVIGIYNTVQFLWVYADCLPYPPIIDKVSILMLVISLLVATLIWVLSDDVPTKNLSTDVAL